MVVVFEAKWPELDGGVYVGFDSDHIDDHDPTIDQFRSSVAYVAADMATVTLRPVG